MEPALRPAVGVDAGGTKVLAVLADDHGSVLDEERGDTPATDAEASAEMIVAVARALRARHPDVAAIGVGAAGLVTNDGILRFAPNVAWREFALRAFVEEALGLPAVVDNDANVAAWGEYRFGAGRGSSDMLMVTVGTGIGGAIVAGGRLFHGAHGFAAEIGHIIVEPGGPLCGCGNRGCWEQVASGRAIGRMGIESARGDPGSGLVRRAGGDAEAITGRIVTAAARQGDAAALEVMARVGRRLGEGIAGLVNVLDPTVVVVGGGATEAGELLLAPARAAFEAAIEAAGHRPAVPLLAALLGPRAGAIGAAALALESLDAPESFGAFQSSGTHGRPGPDTDGPR